MFLSCIHWKKSAKQTGNKQTKDKQKTRIRIDMKLNKQLGTGGSGHETHGNTLSEHP